MGGHINNDATCGSFTSPSAVIRTWSCDTLPNGFDSAYRSVRELRSPLSYLSRAEEFHIPQMDLLRAERVTGELHHPTDQVHPIRNL
jgi:hypothetical protein